MGHQLAIRPDDPSLPPSYEGPRGLILVALKRNGPLSTRQLSEHLGLSSNAVRHHLRELEARQVIGYRREQRGVGAPTFAWHLTESGEGLFPQRYKQLLTELLDRVAEQAGRGAVVSALEARFAELSRKLRAELGEASAERRMDGVARVLVDDGYMAEWRQSERGLHLTEHNCAVRALAERFPEICAAEARFLEEVLEAAVEREAHMLDGCTACEYRVRFAPSGEPALTTLQGTRPRDQGESA